MGLKRLSIDKMKKGFSIAELCIVLALVTIISLSVVSFSSLVSARSKMAAQRLNAIQELTLTESLLEDWTNALMSYDAEISANSSSLVAEKGEERYSAYKSGNKFIASLPDGKSMSADVEYITKLEFEELTNAENEMFLCKATYLINEKEKEYIFCLKSHIGETFEVVETGESE